MHENSAKHAHTHTHTHTHNKEKQAFRLRIQQRFLMTSLSVLNFKEQCEHAPLVLNCMSL